MKAAPFAYVRPTSLEDAVNELAGSDGGGKVLAGGQSLVPVLAMRLARPEKLVDITTVEGLDQLRSTGDSLEVAAMVRQRRVEHDRATDSVPLLRMALPWVGHRELRSRGTVCGSLAHADPAAEIPAVAACLNARITLTSPRGTRQVSAREFFTGAMTTALGSEDILTAIRFPVAAEGEGFGFAEIARRHGDFALAGVAVRVAVSGEHVHEATLTAFGVSDRPVTRDVSTELASAVSASGQDGARLAVRLTEPLAGIAQDMVDTDGDAHGSQDYRRRLLATLSGRELAKAHDRALRGTSGGSS
ncbi:FAD binding domain-containing protein [Actinopolyspora halophila]|uniref:FAD binding domain-containing protein n=1 Tax=Actinopolyspora halophila TaxID=1850 RepID=UPI00035C3E3E|nr:FAD binding domain-containing protein [Actinopolyspora halophila]